MKLSHKQILRTLTSMATATVVSVLAANSVEAQCSVTTDQNLDPTCPDDVGHPVCFTHPFDPPGPLTGMPVWPESGADHPLLTAVPGTSTTRSEASDPRWSGAALRNLFASEISRDVSDRVRYRIVANAANTQLAVTIQIQEVTDLPKEGDYVYFGLAEALGNATDGKAEGIRIALNGFGITPGIHRRVPTSAVVTHTYSGAGTWTGTRNTVPAWIVRGTDGQPLISEWINRVASSSGDADARARAEKQSGVDGATLVVSFKVNLDTPGLRLTGAAAKMSIGAEVDMGAQGQVRWFTPNVDACTGGCPKGEPGDSPYANPFLKKSAQWTPVTTIGAACSGISFVSTDISTPLTCGASNTRTNCVTATATRVNDFRFSPNVTDWWNDKAATWTGPSAFDLPSGWFRATYKMSNWGTVGDPAQWLPLTQVENAALAPPSGQARPAPGALLDFPMNRTCTNSGASTADARNVCGQPITSPEPADPDNGFHQCLLVEMSATPAGTAGGVRFVNPAAYINTAFQRASVVNRVAQVNIKGLVTPVAGQKRDVYLHLVAKNMPALSQTPAPLLNVPALNALRGQIDPGFRVSGQTCSLQQRCYVASPGLTTGRCVSRYVPRVGEEFPCTRVTIDGLEYCAPHSESASCVLPAGGGYNPNASSLTGDQKLAATFPTVTVYPYFDTGKTVTVNGATKKRLKPLQSFGIHSWHEGPYYGWTQVLTDMAGTPLPEVYPDVYKVSVDTATGIANIRVRVEAHEARPVDNLFEIAGTATPLGLALGNATITGVAQTRSLDLSGSTITIQKLLNNNGRELVTSMRAPITLARQPGATRTAATYRSFGFPSITMQVATLPLIGQVLSIQVFLADVSTPASCGLLFGTAPITTTFTIADGTGSPVTVTGTDTWTCVPGQMLNF